MKILAVQAGGFPRVGDSHEQQRLRVAQDSLEQGRLDEAEFANVQNDMVREVLSVQSRAGLDLVSDGQVRWPDAVSHFMGKLEGVRPGGLLRYFDSNTYFRQPQVTGPLSVKGPLTADEFRFARAISPRPVTATVTGPLTLSRLSVPGGPYRDADGLMQAIVPIIAGEVGHLAGGGAANIIIEEPFLHREPGAIAALEDALEVLGGQKGPAKIWLRISYGDCAPLYPALQKLPVDGLILDLTYPGGLADAVASLGSDLPIGLGIINSRDIRLENPRKTVRELERLLRRMHGTEAWIMASNGVDFLPRKRAVEKLELVAKVRDLLTGKAGKKSGSVRARPAGKSHRRRGKSKRAGKVRRNSRPARRTSARRPKKPGGRRKGRRS